MNKQKQLIRGTVTNAGVAFAVLALMGGLYFATSYYADKVAAEKTNVDNALNADNAKIASYSSQIDKSGNALVRFEEIRQGRDNLDFNADFNDFKLWLKNARDQYRLIGLKLTPADEKPTDKSELQSFDYAINVRSGMDISFDAMSDLHALSYLNEMLRQAPGIFNVTHFKITRKGEMDPGMIASMQTGSSPGLVSAVIDFDWITVAPKKAAAAGGAAPAPAMPSAPAPTDKPGDMR